MRHWLLRLTRIPRTLCLIATGVSAVRRSPEGIGPNGSCRRITHSMCIWDQLTPADIERMKQRLLRERDEMLRRHTTELGGLDAEAA